MAEPTKTGPLRLLWTLLDDLGSDVARMRLPAQDGRPCLLVLARGDAAVTRIDLAVEAAEWNPDHPDYRR
jgi:hypothetical protein